MRTARHTLKDPLIFLGLLIAVPCFIYYISMNFGDQRVHIEKKQWNPSEASDQGVDPQRLKRATEYIETRLPLARGMIIIKNGKTVHEKYYWRGGPEEMDYLHSLNVPILYALVGVAIEKKMLTGPAQSLADFFPDYFNENGSSLTIADLLQVNAPLIWGDEAPGYWELFYAADKIKASIQALSSPDNKVHGAANFAASYLLAEIIRKKSSKNVFEFADENLFQPMDSTTLAEISGGKGMMHAFIGFQLRTLDLAKFGYMIMNEGKWQDRQIVPRDWAHKIVEKLRTGIETASWGGWQPGRIEGTESFIALGEGGQYIVMAPELDMLIAITSKSLFPLSENSGYDKLFELIFAAVAEKTTSEEAELAAVNPDERPYYAPNFIYATNVPDDIRQFFYDFAEDIATNDINRILYHYAKGYENRDETYGSMYGYWRQIFFGGTGELEFVHIEKLRVDNNRAYLRGTLKYAYANMNEGSIGWFSLENLIKLRGRWLWFGAPQYGAVLDRDEYFDAEISADLSEFIDECGSALTGATRKNMTACFSEDFVCNGLRQSQFIELLQPFWKDNRKAELHVARVEQSGEEGLLSGYIKDSSIGIISLPAGMKFAKEGGRWKWAGNGIE